MSQAFYNKWRPQRWDEIIGQQHVVQTLRNAVAGDHVSHAYLFAGAHGTGKTTAARLLAKAVNCLNENKEIRPCNECSSCVAINENRFIDLIEIDAASNNSVDDVRNLREKINFSPNLGRYKVYIIDEVHMLSKEAFNALLKTLEEPPDHAIFILATTEMHKIPATILSRCQRHEFRRLSVDDMVNQMEKIVDNEKLIADPEALKLIARQSSGSMRDAISLLDQMASAGGEITLDFTQSVLGIATDQTVIDLIDAIISKEPSAGLKAIHTALDSGTDPRLLARQLVNYLRILLLFQMGNSSQVDLGKEMRLQINKTAKAFSQSDILFMIKIFNNASTELRGGWQPSLSLEVALLEVLESSSIKQNNNPHSPQQNGMNAKILTQGESSEKEDTDTNLESGSVSIGKLLKVWKQIRAMIKPQSPSLEGLLNSCKLLEIKNGTLVIGFQSELLRSKVDKQENLEITRKAIKEISGYDLSVNCVVINNRRSSQLNVKADSMVEAALRAGGEIVDIQE